MTIVKALAEEIVRDPDVDKFTSVFVHRLRRTQGAHKLAILTGLLYVSTKLVSQVKTKLPTKGWDGFVINRFYDFVGGYLTDDRAYKILFEDRLEHKFWVQFRVINELAFSGTIRSLDRVVLKVYAELMINGFEYMMHHVFIDGNDLTTYADWSLACQIIWKFAELVTVANKYYEKYGGKNFYGSEYAVRTLKNLLSMERYDYKDFTVRLYDIATFERMTNW